MTGILAWLHAQATIAMQVISAIISNQSAPARQVVIYTAVIVILAVFLPKIAKKLK